MRRSREDIAAGILKSCAADSLMVSRLMATQNIPYGMLKQHLEKLVSLGLLEQLMEGSRRFFSTSQKGLIAIRCYHNAVGLLNGGKPSCPLFSETGQKSEKTALSKIVS